MQERLFEMPERAAVNNEQPVFERIDPMLFSDSEISTTLDNFYDWVDQQGLLSRIDCMEEGEFAAHYPLIHQIIAEAARRDELADATPRQEFTLQHPSIGTESVDEVGSLESTDGLAKIIPFARPRKLEQ